MGEGTRWLRVRAIASSWFPVLAAALAVLALAGGWAAYTAHAAPGTTDQQSERAHWTVDGSFEHSADVTRENPVFDVGTTLSNRATYFSGAAPVLDGRYVTSYSGTDADPAAVDVNASLVVRGVGEDTVYWTDRTALDEASVESVEPGESVAVSFSLNATRLAEREAEIRQSLGQTPGETEAFVAVDVDAAGTADSRPASLSFTHRLPVAVDGDTYTVGPAEAGREPLTTTETVAVPREYGPLRSVGGPLLFVVGAGGLAALAVARRRDALALTDAERDLLAFRDERAEFDEWVVRVRLPDEVRDRPRADAASLADLVDFAIDSDAGVVEDPGTGTFYVVADDLLVAYEPPEHAREDTAEDATGSGVLDDIGDLLGEDESEGAASEDSGESVAQVSTEGERAAEPER